MSDEIGDRVFGEDAPVKLQRATTPSGKVLDELSTASFGLLRGEPMYYDRLGRPCTAGRAMELMEGLDGNQWIGYDLGRGFIVSTMYEGMRGMTWELWPRVFRTVVFPIATPLSEVDVYYTPNEDTAAVMHRVTVRKWIGRPSKWVRRRRGQALRQRDRHLDRWNRRYRHTSLNRIMHYGSKPPWKKAR